jgi:hypothetical protein
VFSVLSEVLFSSREFSSVVKGLKKHQLHHFIWFVLLKYPNTLPLMKGITHLCLTIDQGLYLINSTFFSHLAQLVSRDNCVPGKHSPHHYTTAISLYRWHQGGWVHGLMLLTPNPLRHQEWRSRNWDYSDQFYTPQLSGAGDRVPIGAAYFGYQLTGVEPGVVNCWNTWQRLTSCVFRGAFPLTTDLLLHYLSVCAPPVSLHNSCHSPSNSHQQAVFAHRTAAD